MQTVTLLKFQNSNAKLGKRVHTFSLPAGYSCPAALDCLSRADRASGQITDGRLTEYRCFAASDEAKSPNARNARWHNFDILRNLDMWAIVNKLQASIPNKAKIVRIHVSGDFYNSKYFKAWMIVARMNPHLHFYAYTKSVNYWVDYINDGYKLPDNINLTASFGGRHDNLIKQYNLKFAFVVYHPDHAKRMGLEIDHDDSLAMYGKKSFALLLHGTQPAKSEASEALSKMRKENIKFSYSKQGANY
tara:strand:+ start:754 stop:1494 length:741 start_codon:yes stop_codon:yes gene_type:complete